MEKPKCPYCRSKSYRPRIKTKDCVCNGCGKVFPNPSYRPDEYEELVESMIPRADELILKALKLGSNVDYKEVIEQVESMTPPPKRFLLDLLKGREETRRKCAEENENINHD